MFDVRERLLCRSMGVQELSNHYCHVTYVQVEMHTSGLLCYNLSAQDTLFTLDRRLECIEISVIGYVSMI